MTYEKRVMNYFADVREAISASAEYAAWRDSLEAIEIDDEVLYIRGGDMLKDEDEIMFEWARLQGMISDDDIREALRSDES